MNELQLVTNHIFLDFSEILRLYLESIATAGTPLNTDHIGDILIQPGSVTVNYEFRSGGIIVPGGRGVIPDTAHTLVTFNSIDLVSYKVTIAPPLSDSGIIETPNIEVFVSTDRYV